METTSLDEILERRAKITPDYRAQLEHNAEEIADVVIPYALQRGFKRVDRADDSKYILVGRKNFLKNGILVIDPENEYQPLQLCEKYRLNGINEYLRGKSPFSKFGTNILTAVAIGSFISGVNYASMTVANFSFAMNNHTWTLLFGFIGTCVSLISIMGGFPPLSPGQFIGEKAFERLQRYRKLRDLLETAAVAKPVQTAEEGENDTTRFA